MQAGKIFISGTNRGLGKQLVKLLRKQNPEQQLHISSRGDIQTYSEELKKDNLGDHLHLYRLNLIAEESVIQNAKLIQQKGIIFNTIVANAAYGADYGTIIPSYDVAFNTVMTNTIATIKFIKEFLPSLAPNGRLVIVSTLMAALNAHSQTFRKTLQNPEITEEQIIKIGLDYIEHAKNKDMGDYHWSAYRVSKALINAWARFVLPKYLKPDQTFVCLHPGWCSTDMGGKGAFLTPQEGAALINEGIWLQKVDHSLFFNKKFCSFEACQ